MTAANMRINKEWGRHVPRAVKKATNKKRRADGRRACKED